VSLWPGITDVRQIDIFRILSAILHLGNVAIEKEERFVDKCHIAVRNTFEVLFLLSDSVVFISVFFSLCAR